MSAAQNHLPMDALLAYWLHETDPAATDAVDEHLMQCDACGQLLDEVVALGAGMREALQSGEVAVVTSGAFVRRLAGMGLRIREYSLPRNGAVNCTVAPDDQLVVSRLQAPLHGVSRLDLRAELSLEPGVHHTMEDVPIDPTAGEVLYLSKLAQVRQSPAATMRVTLLAVEPGGTRELGHYAFHHQPWPGA